MTQRFRCPKCGIRSIPVGAKLCTPCEHTQRLLQKDQDERIRQLYPPKHTPRLPFTTRRPGNVKH